MWFISTVLHRICMLHCLRSFFTHSFLLVLLYVYSPRHFGYGTPRFSFFTSSQLAPLRISIFFIILNHCRSTVASRGLAPGFSRWYLASDQPVSYWPIAALTTPRNSSVFISGNEGTDYIAHTLCIIQIRVALSIKINYINPFFHCFVQFF
jgi:hypothetical protein